MCATNRELGEEARNRFTSSAPPSPSRVSSDDDHVRPRAHGGLDASEGIGRDLDLEIVLPQHVVLEAGDLVGRVAEQHRGGHLQGVSALAGGG